MFSQEEKDQYRYTLSWKKVVQMKKVDQSLDLACPICAARSGHPCVNVFGGLRNQSHLRRRDLSKDLETAVHRLQLVPSQPDGPTRRRFDQSSWK
jgi:hypothetical protein